MPPEKTDLIVEVARLNHFLRNNQLVQAHAIAQKVEVMINRALASVKGDATKHPYFESYTQALQVKSCILSGKTNDAKGYCEHVGIILTKESA